MKYLVFVIALLAGGNCFAQPDSLQKQINEQVWKPFIHTFNNRDDAGFSAVHSKDVIRVEQDGNRLYGYNEYFKEVPDSVKAKRAAWQRKIELRFLQRIVSADKAFETGYYKTIMTNATTGQERTGYGKFHVLLRKEKGAWKIVMDADAKDDANETRFQSAKPLE